MKRLSSLIALAALSVLLVGHAAAFEWPVVMGDYWDVTGIYIKDGGNLKYLNYLAGEWRKLQEFSKSKGWIKNYMILSNVNARSGEPSIYLITVMDSVVSGAEGEKRNREFEAWSKKTNEALEAEAGNRAEYREVKSDLLLQELKFKN
jgi:hypothetical protein